MCVKLTCFALCTNTVCLKAQSSLPFRHYQEFHGALHCTSVNHYPCPECQTQIKVAVNHAEIVCGWSELHAMAPHYRCDSLAGQNNGVCIEGPLMLSFYLPPGRQSCIFKEDMHTVYVNRVHTIIQEFLHCT